MGIGAYFRMHYKEEVALNEEGYFDRINKVHFFLYKKLRSRVETLGNYRVWIHSETRT